MTIIPILPGLPATQNPAPEYVIEKILKGQYRNRRLQYLVKWKIFPHFRNTWEPECNLNAAALNFLNETQ